MSVYKLEIELIGKRMCNIVETLSKMYNFNYNEALEFLSLEDNNINSDKIFQRPLSEEKHNNSSSIPLPFCGYINERCCMGIKLNHSLYTQCQSKSVNGEFCKVCYNQTQKNSSAKPTYGVISDRLVGDICDYRDPRGKKVVNYGNIMEKLNISKEMAEQEAQKQGVIIPELQFQVIRNQRGRPKKNKEVSVDDTDSEKSVPQEKKPRGRPKKEQKEIKANDSDHNIIASLLAEANINNYASSSDSKNKITSKEVKKEIIESKSDSDDSDDSDDEEINVTIFKYKGPGEDESTDYFKTEDNILYDKDSNLVGKWNSIKKIIEFD